MAKSKKGKKKARLATKPARSRKPAAVKVKKVASKTGLPRSKAGVTPLGDRVLIKPLSQEEGVTTSFGIIIPDTAKEKPEQGRVVAVGAGKKTDEGKFIPLSVKVGDRVMFSKYGYDEIKVGGVEYFIVREESILAVLD